MPYLPQDFRPVPGMPPAAAPTMAPTETTLPPPEEPKSQAPRPDKPRYRTYRPKDQMLPKLSILNYEPDRQAIVDQMLRGGVRK